jgi:hypothetical protein
MKSSSAQPSYLNQQVDTCFKIWCSAQRIVFIVAWGILHLQDILERLEKEAFMRSSHKTRKMNT